MRLHETQIRALASTRKTQKTQNKPKVLQPATIKILSLSVNSATALPNIDYALFGYNILYGNPLATGGTTDPGFVSPIFVADYSEKLLSADRRFLQPKGITLVSCDGNCDLEFRSEEISGTKSYTDRLDVKVN